MKLCKGASWEGGLTLIAFIDIVSVINRYWDFL